MADEITIRTSLLIRKNSLHYQSNPQTFRASMTGYDGPTPGAVTVPTTGVNIDLSQLTTPGICWIQNLGRADGVVDAEAYVTLGVDDASQFHPFIELLAGEFYAIRLSRNFGEEHSEGGTGTSGTINNLRAMAHGASQNVIIHAFEK